MFTEVGVFVVHEEFQQAEFFSVVVFKTRMFCLAFMFRSTGSWYGFVAVNAFRMESGV